HADPAGAGTAHRAGASGAGEHGQPAASDRCGISPGRWSVRPAGGAAAVAVAVLREPPAAAAGASPAERASSAAPRPEAGTGIHPRASGTALVDGGAGAGQRREPPQSGASLPRQSADQSAALSAAVPSGAGPRLPAPRSPGGPAAGGSAAPSGLCPAQSFHHCLQAGLRRTALGNPGALVIPS